MEIIPADMDGIRHALAILRRGGTVAHATETCYGLACDLKNPQAVAKLFAIKQRPLDQPVSALFTSVDDAKKYVEWNDEAEILAKKHLPGPLTLILHRKPITSYELQIIPNSEIRNSKSVFSVGIRVSSLPLASQLVREFGSPISTTSANIHGKPNPYSADDILKQFEGQEFQPDVILDSGKLPPTPPSTVIDLTKSDGQIRRSGSVQPGGK